jgi:hypothetical protein
MAKKREAREALKLAEASGLTVEELLKQAATDPELADKVQRLALEDQAQSNLVKAGQTTPPPCPH